MEETTQQAAPLVDILTRQGSWMLMAGTWIVIQMVIKFIPDRIYNAPWFVRLQSILPILLCSAGVWIPGIVPDGATVGEKILTGVILGYAVAHTYKIVLQSVLGRDRRIAESKAKRKSATVLSTGGTP